jgi:hypothetical protein
VTQLFTDLEPQKGPRHESYDGGYDTWLTPPFIIEALGPFDLDPCSAPEPRPWPTAAVHWLRSDNPLLRPWHGRVWLNPPYGAKEKIGPWLGRMAEHNRGTALIFARTETKLFFDHVWYGAAAILFLRGRLNFYRPDGTLSDGQNATAPSVLVAYGHDDAERLRVSKLEGRYVTLTADAAPAVTREQQLKEIEAAITVAVTRQIGSEIFWARDREDAIKRAARAVQKLPSVTPNKPRG